MWKKDNTNPQSGINPPELQNPAPHNQSSGIAYTVVFDNIDGQMISTPVKKNTNHVDKTHKTELGIMDDDDEKLMAEIMDEVESKERKEKLDEKLLIAEIMREAQLKEKTDKAKRSRKGILQNDKADDKVNE